MSHLNCETAERGKIANVLMQVWRAVTYNGRDVGGKLQVQLARKPRSQGEQEYDPTVVMHGDPTRHRNSNLWAFLIRIGF